LFMHFLGASCDGLVARRVDLDTISSSARGPKALQNFNFLRNQTWKLEHEVIPS
jgi:hypothetical protein